MTKFRFRRGERLKSRKMIEQLFAGANSASRFPLLLLWKEMEPEAENTQAYPVQFTASVSKRKFKKAVDRNFIKRRVREAYRLNKHLLYENLPEQAGQLAFMIIFTGKKLEDCDRVDKSMKKLLQKFLEQYEP